ncbi:hypothetical protein [Candidatus Methylacidiphilum fumarolicum]|uniref:hypothetical protein n=1 Tax=Candidatus Methylacidiphilum fumarolicum TaxID=591154 RepID=UPI000AD85A1A|nr:hypothetical protein [Candidatus Methylacidiphilum fumarolicum]
MGNAPRKEHSRRNPTNGLLCASRETRFWRLHKILIKRKSIQPIALSFIDGVHGVGRFIRSIALETSLYAGILSI